MTRRCALRSASLLAAALSSTGVAAAMPACGADIAVRFDRQGGAFDGMSQSGVLMVLRNVGTAACGVPGLPTVRFVDEAGHPLAIVREAPPGMHPGPVVPAVGLAPQAEAAAILQWTSGDVFDGHHCITPASVAVGDASVVAFETWRFGPLCGPPGKPIPFRQSVLRAQAVATP